jgi:hypothetical protein
VDFLATAQDPAAYILDIIRETRPGIFSGTSGYPFIDRLISEVNTLNDRNLATAYHSTFQRLRSWPGLDQTYLETQLQQAQPQTNIGQQLISRILATPTQPVIPGLVQPTLTPQPRVDPGKPPLRFMQRGGGRKIPTLPANHHVSQVLYSIQLMVEHGEHKKAENMAYHLVKWVVDHEGWPPRPEISQAVEIALAKIKSLGYDGQECLTWKLTQTLSRLT